MALAACESDFTPNPNRPRPTRALEDPFARGSANSEVMAGPTTVLPLLTVELPNTKEEEPKVRTIADAFVELNQRATTRPAAASQPATQPTGDTLKIVAQQRPTDVITITRDNEANADMWVLCPTGIGTVTLERTGKNWPAIIRVHLRYDANRPFTMLEGFNAYELPGDGGGDRRVTLKTTSDKATATAQIAIPGFSRAPRIAIEWVDAYR